MIQESSKKGGLFSTMGWTEIQGEYETLEGWAEDISGCLGGVKSAGG